MIAQIRPTKPAEPASPLSRARRMVAESLLPEKDQPSPRWERQTWIVVSAAVALFGAGVLVYCCFR